VEAYSTPLIIGFMFYEFFPSQKEVRFCKQQGIVFRKDTATNLRATYAVVQYFLITADHGI
jgi:hypothetical protein